MVAAVGEPVEDVATSLLAVIAVAAVDVATSPPVVIVAAAVREVEGHYHSAQARQVKPGATSREAAHHQHPLESTCEYRMCLHTNLGHKIADVKIRTQRGHSACPSQLEDYGTRRQTTRCDKVKHP